MWLLTVASAPLQTDVEDFKKGLKARMRWQSVRAREIDKVGADPSEICDTQLAELDAIKLRAEGVLEQNLSRGLFKCIITPTTDRVFSMCKTLREVSLECLKVIANLVCERLHAEMQEVLERLDGRAPTVDEYADLKSFIDMQMRDVDFPTEYGKVMKIFESLEFFCMENTDADVERQWTGFHIANNMHQQLVVRKRNLYRDAKVLLNELEGKEQKLKDFAANLLQRVFAYAKICAIVEIEQSDAFVLAKMQVIG